MSGYDSIQYEPGWLGAFTRDSAPGAIANGLVVRKVNSEKDDLHPNGTRGVVVGSVSAPDVRGGEICYFIEWLPRKTGLRIAAATLAFKVQAVA